MNQLEALGCKHIQYRFYSPLPFPELERLVTLTDGRKLLGIDIFLPYADDLADTKRLRALCRRYPRLLTLVLTNAPEERRENVFEQLDNMGVLVYHRGVVDSPRCCGVVDRSFFHVSMASFTEALHFNSCLNRKISVDARGDIRNCPAMAESYGNTTGTSLREAHARSGFQDVWSVTKDRVAVCRDCEFRYICPDCRALTEQGDPLGKPVSCGYDPYTATWSETCFPPYPV